MSRFPVAAPAQLHHKPGGVAFALCAQLSTTTRESRCGCGPIWSILEDLQHREAGACLEGSILSPSGSKCSELGITLKDGRCD